MTETYRQVVNDEIVAVLEVDCDEEVVKQVVYFARKPGIFFEEQLQDPLEFSSDLVQKAVSAIRSEQPGDRGAAGDPQVGSVASDEQVLDD